MSIQEFEKLQAEIPAPELIERAREYIRDVSKKGQREWRMTIPPSRYDADMVFGEVCRRLEELESFNNFNLINSAQTLLDNLEETHAALCFTPDYIGSLRYKQNKAAIEAAKGI